MYVCVCLTTKQNAQIGQREERAKSSHDKQNGIGGGGGSPSESRTCRQQSQQQHVWPWRSSCCAPACEQGVGMLMGEGGRLISSERINVHIARWRLCKFTWDYPIINMSRCPNETTKWWVPIRESVCLSLSGRETVMWAQVNFSKRNNLVSDKISS